MLEILQKPFHRKASHDCQYCDNYWPNAHFPAKHRIKITAFGAQPSGCEGYIHVEAIPNERGGITVIYACDSCGFGASEDMENV